MIPCYNCMLFLVERPWNALCNRGCVHVCVYHCKNLKVRIILGQLEFAVCSVLISLSVCFSSAMGVGG